MKRATDAPVYGDPLVTMEMPRRVLNNVVAPTSARAPLDSILTQRKYPRGWR